GLAVTLALHVALVGLMLASGDAHGCGGRAEASSFEEAETIEAALAFKQVEAKDRQPQKQRKPKAPPVDPLKLARESIEMPDPEPPKEEPPERPKEVEIDPMAVLRKNRVQDEDLSSTGVDELPREGSASGSEWGTERDARGDPYVGELVGRIKSAWAVPALETGAGTAVGCVRLDGGGTIVARELKTRSGNANLDR